MPNQPFLKPFLKIIQNKKLAHLYLITGLDLPQRKKFVLELSYQILKSQENTQNHSFLKQTLTEGTYPNFYYLKKDNHLFKKEQILQLKDFFSQSSLFGEQRIYVIEEMEKTTLPAANSLLHFLENTPNNIIGFLLTDNLHQVLTTIVSRCQVINIDVFKQQLLTPAIEERKLSQEIDVMNCALIPLINISSDENTAYYLEFKKYFLFFLEQFPKDGSCATYDFATVLINSFAVFLSDLVSVLLRWFLDLFYQKKQLPIYFENQAHHQKEFQNLTLQRITNILEILQKYHQEKINLVNPQNLFFALILELEQQKYF
ncbi:DNA polymerase III, delta prime subunit [Candidatus Phytoplasma australiense]|uniref:DNA polymerase III, delta prime subunit n=2 Tax=Phytoplasma australiense TaxID=59748 RepID=B1V971_PHYAS|nr:DNA polymerase III, delta prime subunit [Candidatus Phytoplasma australiense]AGL90832.1 DNA polymerase III delta' subunit [Strawberry lethal yellows phytoplasma (CPA) str. NZSb11]CAM11503.1 DNA polymerase III, delta prime subunit [Candidatus Phytoplasma australiense]